MMRCEEMLRWSDDQTWSEDKEIDNAMELELKAGSDNEEYKIEDICNSVVYARESEASHLSGLYYQVSWKGYSKDKSTWELASAI